VLRQPYAKLSVRADDRGEARKNAERNPAFKCRPEGHRDLAWIQHRPSARKQIEGPDRAGPYTEGAGSKSASGDSYAAAGFEKKKRSADRAVCAGSTGAESTGRKTRGPERPMPNTKAENGGRNEVHRKKSGESVSCPISERRKIVPGRCGRRRSSRTRELAKALQACKPAEA